MIKKQSSRGIKKTKRIGVATLFVFMSMYLCLSVGMSFSLETVEDLDFIKQNVFNYNSIYNDKQISVNSIQTSEIGKTFSDSQQVVDLYALSVPFSGFVNIRLETVNKMYYTNLDMSPLYFISNTSGTKQSYMALDEGNHGFSSKKISDLGMKGITEYRGYLTAGTYYFAVSGKQYNKPEKNENYLEKVTYQISTGLTAAQENLNSGEDRPYVVHPDNDLILGHLSSELYYSEAQQSYKLDGIDKIVFPAGDARRIKLIISIKPSENSDFIGMAYETVKGNQQGDYFENYKVASGFYEYGAGELRVNVLDSGNNLINNGTAIVRPNSSTELILDFQENESYSLTLRQKYAMEYSIIYQDMNQPLEHRTGTELAVSAIITDKITGKQPIVNKVTINEKDCRITKNSVLNQCAPNDTQINITVDAQGYNIQSFSFPVHFDGLNVNYIELESDGDTVQTSEIITEEEQMTNPLINGYEINGYQVERMPYYDGVIEQTADGLKMLGGEHTNGRVISGRRDGNGVITVEKFDLLNKSLYTSFTIYGENYASIGSGIENVVGGTPLSTHHSWAGSITVPSGTKIYKILSVSETGYNMILTTGNFYNMQGAHLLYEEQGNLSEVAKVNVKGPQSIYFYLTDNYGGASSYIVPDYLSVEPYVDLQSY